MKPYIAAWFFKPFGNRVAEVKVYVVKYRHTVQTTTKEIKDTKYWKGSGNIADKLVNSKIEEGQEQKEETQEYMWGY